MRFSSSIFVSETTASVSSIPSDESRSWSVPSPLIITAPGRRSERARHLSSFLLDYLDIDTALDKLIGKIDCNLASADYQHISYLLIAYLERLEHFDKLAARSGDGYLVVCLKLKAAVGNADFASPVNGANKHFHAAQNIR